MSKKATPAQGFAIFLATGFDIRPLEMSFETASEIMEKKDKEFAVQKIQELASQKNVKLVRKNDGKGFQPSAKERSQKFEAIWEEAHQAGMLAGMAKVPTPMIVQQHLNPLDDNSPVVQSWNVPQGVCGFAWVIVRPANSSFAIWAKENKDAARAYEGGMKVKWVSEFNQSVEQKYAYACAFAEVLNKYGINAHACDRVD